MVSTFFFFLAFILVGSYRIRDSFSLLPLKVIINKVTGGVFGKVNKNLNLAFTY